VTGRRTNRLSWLAAIGLLASACTSGAAASPSSAAPSVVASVPASASAASEAPSVAPSVAPSASAIAAPTSLLKAGELSDCVDIEYSPMEFFDPAYPDRPIGFDVESYQAVARTLGLKENIVNTAFDGLIPALQANRCDIVWTALYINATRQKVADAVPYFKTSQVIMVPTGNPKGIKSEADLCGKSVSIQGGGLVQERITAASAKCPSGQAIKIQAYPKVADEYQQIVIGRVDAVWEIDTSVADFQLKNPGKYDVAFSVPGDDKYGIYFGKGKTDVGTALTAALKSLKADGTLAGIAQKYNLDPANLSVIQ
jgi:polar amino acid transport system substrate-binding protein